MIICFMFRAVEQTVFRRHERILEQMSGNHLTYAEGNIMINSIMINSIIIDVMFSTGRQPVMGSI